MAVSLILDSSHVWIEVLKHRALSYISIYPSWTWYQIGRSFRYVVDLGWSVREQIFLARVNELGLEQKSMNGFSSLSLGSHDVCGRMAYRFNPIDKK
uniref:Uncharacterized protein n=1 Tax=Kalanchoe fedtschenkoi TaxID=63787 RepID=A0A7N0T5E9_KALFE